MSVSIGVAVLLAMAAVVPIPSASASDAPPPLPERTALVLGGTTVPTPDQFYLDTVRDHFVGPTQPGQVTYVPVMAPMTVWPAPGIGRIIWLVTGPKSIWGPGGPAWPDEPLWKLSGSFDRHSLHQVCQNAETTIRKPPTASPRAPASIDTHI